MEGLLLLHSEVFSGKLGRLQGVEGKLSVTEMTSPKFYRPRQVPYALREKIEEELFDLTKAGIIEAILYSEWAAPIVPVVKSNGKVRICGDYRLTVNQVLRCDTYPIPRIEDLFARIAEGQQFTTLDLDRAYQQLVLDEESRKYVVINTRQGLFQYNRLPFGVLSAPGIFRRTMETLLQEIPGVVVYLDDILITGRNEQEHLSNLGKVLMKLEEARLRLNKDKCWFMQPEVVYLGQVIDKTGLHLDKGRIQAIMEAPRPQNVTELKVYLGLLSYYDEFVTEFVNSFSSTT